jgi:hypothetical protein
MKLKAKELLTSNFFDLLGASIEAHGYEAAGTYVVDNKEAIAAYSTLMYANIPFWDFLDDLLISEIVEMTYVAIGGAWSKIFNALMTEYNPLENFFTDGTSETDGSGSLTKEGEESISKEGSEITTPSGKMLNTRTGDRITEYENRGNIGQGTTYDSATTDPTSDDFYNISKNIIEGKEKEKFNNYKSETSFENYSVEHTFENRADTKSFTDRVDSTTNHEEVEEHRRGNSGIFSKQDLIQREIKLRFNNQVVPILVRMIVDTFNTGVWENDD